VTLENSLFPFKDLIYAPLQLAKFTVWRLAVPLDLRQSVTAPGLKHKANYNWEKQNVVQSDTSTHISLVHVYENRYHD